MVSCGPNTQSWNMTHMFSFVDLRSDTDPKWCINKGTLLDVIYNNPNFSKFLEITKKAKMTNQLNNEQANFTLFLPLDDSLQHIPQSFFDNMDDGLARQIFNSSIMDRKLTKDLITSSPVSYYYTKNPQMRIYATNIGGQTRLNNCATIVQYDVMCTNGLIHIINGILVPNEDHFMN